MQDRLQTSNCNAELDHINIISLIGAMQLQCVNKKVMQCFESLFGWSIFIWPFSMETKSEFMTKQSTLFRITDLFKPPPGDYSQLCESTEHSQVYHLKKKNTYIYRQTERHGCMFRLIKTIF